LRLADNKIVLNGGRDTDQLRIEIEELSNLDVDFDLTVTGFSTGALDLLLEGTADPMDEVGPELPAKPRAKAGDIWVRGPHRIGCGGGRDLGFLTKVVGQGSKSDAAFLDPPYNIRMNAHANAKRPAPRVRDGLERHGPSRVPGLLEGHTRHLRQGFAGWRRAFSSADQCRSCRLLTRLPPPLRTSTECSMEKLPPAKS
jgi:hypothetical protein